MEKKILYKYSREEIIYDIKMAKQTSDGVYWCPDIMKKMKETVNGEGREGKRGYDDKEYIINRTYFFNKPFYTHKDLLYFNNVFFNEICFNYNLWKYLNLKFYNGNKDIMNIKDLEEEISGNKLKDIIDMFLIFNNYYLI